MKRSVECCTHFAVLQVLLMQAPGVCSGSCDGTRQRAKHHRSNEQACSKQCSVACTRCYTYAGIHRGRHFRTCCTLVCIRGTTSAGSSAIPGLRAAVAAEKGACTSDLYDNGNLLSHPSAGATPLLCSCMPNRSGHRKPLHSSSMRRNSISCADCTLLPHCCHAFASPCLHQGKDCNIGTAV